MSKGIRYLFASLKGFVMSSVKRTARLLNHVEEEIKKQWHFNNYRTRFNVVEKVTGSVDTLTI